MIMPDVNIIVGAMRINDPHHHQLKEWLANAVDGTTPLGMSTFVIGGVVRVMSSLKIEHNRKSMREVVSDLDRLLRRRNVEIVYPGPRHWDLFSWLCNTSGFSGGRVSDLQHAAIAIEYDATWVSLDQDFARIPSLRWELPSLN